MNEEIKNVEAVEAVENINAQEEETHVTFEVLKGANNEHKFYFAVPKQVSLGIAYDAAFDVLNHVAKVIQDTTAKMAPKKEEQIQPESEENKEA